MAQQLERSVPAHLKQYVGPYMQQHVMSSNMTAPGATVQPTGNFRPHAPSAPLRRQDFPQSSVEPPPVQQITPQPMTTTEPAPDSAYPPGYDFIINPPKPARRAWRLPSGSSLASRALILSGGLLVLIIALIIIKNLIAGSPSWLPFVAVVQDQQELIHLASNAGTSQSQALSIADQNVAATVSLSVTSSQTSLSTYLANNNYKLGTKTLNLKVSASLDMQLTNAVAAGTYDQTFQQIIQTQLNNYANDLKLAYKGAGTKGRVLLNSDYQQVLLLNKQLSAASSS